jgi:hypothetical protein
MPVRHPPGPPATRAQTVGTLHTGGSRKCVNEDDSGMQQKTASNRLGAIHHVRKTGAASVVIGKAIYEGAFTIEEALAAASARGK